MGLYYSTDMVLRWYKADDSQLKQDRGRTQYTAISNDALVDLRENGITENDVRQWLEENHVPMDIHRPMTERFQMTHWHK